MGLPNRLSRVVTDITPGIRVVAQGETVEINLYDCIGEGIFSDGTTPQQIADALKGHELASEIHVRINSPGGSVFDGFAIYNLLKGHSARVVVDIDGLAASIASVIALAGDEVRIAQNAMFMIHNPRLAMAGTAKELREKADFLDKLTENAVTIYAGRSGQSPEDIRAAMDAETWYTAAEALELGYVDEITTAQQIAASLTPDQAKAFGFHSVPKALFPVVAPAAAVLTPPNAGRPPTAQAGDGEENTPMSQKLYEALGAKDEAGALVVAQTAIATITALTALMPSGSLTDAENALKSAAAMRVQLQELTGKEGNEALAVLTAWKDSAGAATEAVAKLAELEAANVKAEADTLIADAIKAGKLPPAKKENAEAMFSKWGIGALRAHIEALEPVVHTPGAVPRPPAGAPAGKLSEEDEKTRKMLGLTAEQFTKNQEDFERLGGAVK